MAKASDNVFPKLLLAEGAAPATPAAGVHGLFVDTVDDKLKRIDSAGVVSTVEGGGGAGGTPRICLLTKNAAQAVAASTWTAVTFDAEASDVLNMHSTSSNTTRITVPTTGFYLVTSTVVLSANTRAYLQFAVNGTRKPGRNEVTPNGAIPGNGELTRILQLTAGDYLETFIYLLDVAANVGGSATYSDDCSTFSVAYMSGV